MLYVAHVIGFFMLIFLTMIPCPWPITTVLFIQGLLKENQ
jgi:heme/copper-type cytochrome/quinol oxidase subunit 4